MKERKYYGRKSALPAAQEEVVRDDRERREARGVPREQTLLVQATVALKEATDKFFYFETKLANGKKVILHVGRYKALQMLYLYAASKELPEYVEKSR